MPPTTWSGHLRNRVGSTAKEIIELALGRCHAENFDKPVPRVWVAVHQLEYATVCNRRQVENGLKEAAAKGMISFEFDPKQPGGWWITPHPENFAAGPPNPRRKARQRKAKTASFEARLPMAACQRPTQFIALEAPPDSPQNGQVRVTQSITSTQSIADQPPTQRIASVGRDAPGLLPLYRRTPGEETQRIASAQSIAPRSEQQPGTHPDAPGNAVKCAYPYCVRTPLEKKELASLAQPVSETDVDELMQRITRLQESGWLVKDRLEVVNRQTCANLLRSARAAQPGPADIEAFLRERSPGSKSWTNWAVVVTAVKQDFGPWFKTSGLPRPRNVSRPLEPNPVVFPDSPEIPDSPWLAIKQHIAQEISEVEYANWIGPTRFSHQEGETLVVLTPDEVTNGWMEQEYPLRVANALQELDLPIKAVVYRVRGPS
jgi:hypothetical protein